MFQEAEEGKPKRWGCLVAVIIIVTAINLSIIITIRALLDSEDDINMPIIQGTLREDLTYFLGIFTMTFFFGCYCCFCCACTCCKWCFYQFPESISKLWTAIPNLFVNNLDHLPIHRFRETDDNANKNDCVAEARGVLSNKLQEKRSDRCAYENSGYLDVMEMDNIQTPRLILPPAPNGRMRSYSIDISLAAPENS
ncbi:unnamed protein product [Caenorhabditis angaria]|uniref:Uncharacterized protein n=1 Tax=Caenorhabditis angaria TaxID=860376 RepID=A0A9P1NBE6_9PELO|nr:unnamed protein product [Caenorhabditis angaria]